MWAWGFSIAWHWIVIQWNKKPWYYGFSHGGPYGNNLNLTQHYVWYNNGPNHTIRWSLNTACLVMLLQELHHNGCISTHGMFCKALDKKTVRVEHCKENHHYLLSTPCLLWFITRISQQSMVWQGNFSRLDRLIAIFDGWMDEMLEQTFTKELGC